VLAHAFYPQSGETHFDVEEQWVDGDTEDIDLMDGIDLMTVAGHELGHALGLGHSEVPGALMAPYYQGYEPNFSLPDDDRQAIQSLYGTCLDVNVRQGVNIVSFLSRVSTAMLTYVAVLTCDIDIAILSVRLSVCHVPVLCRNGLTYQHTFFSVW